MPESLAYRAYWLLWHSLDWIYPPSCAGCGKTGSVWCVSCAEEVTQLIKNICPMCGIMQRSEILCTECRQATSYYQALRSWGRYTGKLRQAIHQLKYKHNVSLGQALAVPMIQRLTELNWPVDVITPVPLGLARLAERGYNQASLLARPIALYFRIMYAPGILWRQRETISQVGLALASRKENVAGAFSADRKLVRGKTVLVIDDVITSGSTMNACAMALVEAGAEAVYGFSLARAGNDN